MGSGGVGWGSARPRELKKQNPRCGAGARSRAAEGKFSFFLIRPAVAVVFFNSFLSEHVARELAPAPPGQFFIFNLWGGWRRRGWVLGSHDHGITWACDHMIIWSHDHVIKIIMLWSCRGRFGVILGSIWNRSGVVLVSIWSRSRVIVGPFLSIFTFYLKIVPGMHFQVHSAWKNLPELIATDGLGQKPNFGLVFEGHFFDIFHTLFC